jgi:peptidoglycan/LPS O-acetylase OafA/YrhL
VSTRTEPAVRTTDRRPRTKLFRTDIQALRAVAVGMVVLNHLWPNRLTGGYVGVDVFFVISGFLITGHLVSELERSGRVRLGAFYARRIRRLLPAAFLVLLVSLILVVALLPYPRWERNAWEVAASAGYVENWLLAALSVNYSALNDAASVVQHYWSLSVEEQFYIVWPLLLLTTVLLLRRFRRTSTLVRGLVVVVAAVGLLSLASSVVYTLVAPSQAYFATFTRAWEFAAGGLIALLGRRLPLTRLAANLLSLVGFAMIAVAALTFDHTTVFPGYAALLPVVGTAAVIISGARGLTLWHARISSLRPVQWLGGISYSLYLWHWPLIVVTPFLLGAEASTLSKVGVLAVALILSALSKRYVEDSGQRWAYWQGSTRRAMTSMLAGMAVLAVVVGATLGWFHVKKQADQPPAEVAVSTCEGPDALSPGADCPDAFGPADYTVMTTKNEYFFAPDECGGFLPDLTYGDKKTTTECDFSNGEPDAFTVWLVGDSHAQQWQGAIFDIARDRKWVVRTSYFGGCPAADVAFQGFRSVWGPADAKVCQEWSHDLSAAIEEQKPDLVVTAMASRNQLVDDGSGRTMTDQMVAGLVNYWDRWAEGGTKVLALADPPYNGEVRSPDCVLLSEAAPDDCARPRAQAQPPDPVVAAAGEAGSSSISVLDLSDRFCDETSCYAVIGGIPVYYDADHLNLEYVRMLRPQIEERVSMLLGE